jgi:hypothetical protein
MLPTVDHISIYRSSLWNKQKIILFKYIEGNAEEVIIRNNSYKQGYSKLLSVGGGGGVTRHYTPDHLFLQI